MATKTINLTGAEVAVTGLDGSHAHIRNDGTEVIYAAKTAGITAGADGVASIPAGQSDTIRGISGAVYLLGTGSVLIQSDDYVASPFKTSAQAGGSGADEVARAAINTHSGNADIHVTAEDKAKWNAVNYSNPNLLINYDFKINQRDAAGTISTPGYFVDRWKLEDGEVTINTDGTLTLNGTISQTLENAAGTDVTASASSGTASYDNSAKTFTLTADGETISWAKLEAGSIATKFSPPDMAAELLKCQRYLQKYSNGTIGTGYAISDTQAVVFLPLKTNLRGLSGVNMKLNGTLSLGTVTHSGSNSLNCTSVTYNKTSISYCKVVCTAAGLTAGEPVEAQIRTAGDMLLISAEL